jgi:phosphopentomutase
MFHINLGTRTTFADMGQTVAQLFKTEKLRDGESFLKEIIRF